MSGLPNTVTSTEDMLKKKKKILNEWSSFIYSRDGSEMTRNQLEEEKKSQFKIKFV